MANETQHQKPRLRLSDLVRAYRATEKLPRATVLARHLEISPTDLGLILDDQPVSADAVIQVLVALRWCPKCVTHLCDRSEAALSPIRPPTP